MNLHDNPIHMSLPAVLLRKVSDNTCHHGAKTQKTTEHPKQTIPNLTVNELSSTSNSFQFSINKISPI